MNLKHANITLMLFILCLQPICAQNGFTNKEEAKNETFKGLKQGKWIEYLDSKLNITTQDMAKNYKLIVYKDDIASEIIRYFYYPSGILQIETSQIIDGKLNGILKRYYESGKLKAEEIYNDGKKNGTTKYYFENGKISQVEDWIDGEINGRIKTYLEDGSLYQESTWSNGKPIQTIEGEQDAKLRYQMATDQYEKQEYTKALNNLYVAVSLDTNARVKTSYLQAKCMETFLYQNSTESRVYERCLRFINYYIENGKDEEKKTELRKMKITIEDNQDYQQKKSKVQN